MADPVLGEVQEGDTFRCTLWQTLYGQTVLNSLYYQVSEVTLPGADRWNVMVALSNAMVTGPDGIWVQMRALQSEDITHDFHRVQLLLEIDRTYPYFQEDINEAGGILTPSNLANVALSIEKRASFPPTQPRKGIGRMQVAGIPNDTYAGGIFDPGYLANYANMTQDMTDPISVTPGGVTLRPVLSAPGTLTWTDQPIYACTAKNTVRTMNRRTVGRGV